MPNEERRPALLCCLKNEHTAGASRVANVCLGERRNVTVSALVVAAIRMYDDLLFVKANMLMLSTYSD